MGRGDSEDGRGVRVHRVGVIHFLAFGYHKKTLRCLCCSPTKPIAAVFTLLSKVG